MIHSLYIYQASGSDPFENLAREQVLLEQGPADGVILYLWQNQNTVVIGRNQNAFKECRTSLLEEEGGKLARRLSGGGAVFHDLGNLCFSFISHAKIHNVTRQLSVIADACRSFGIDAEPTGRNDIEADGRKFSGNATADHKGAKLFHGTLLISGNLDRLSGYLTVDPKKIQSKGIASVRSRVCNLTEFSSELTVNS